MPPTSPRTYPTFSPDSRSSQFLKNHQFCSINSDFTTLSKGECPRRVSSLIRANSGEQTHRGRPCKHGKSARPHLSARLSHLSPLQEWRRSSILGSPHAGLPMCPTCSCRPQSRSASVHGWNAFLNTVIYPPENTEHAPLPPQHHVLLIATPSHIPLTCLRKGGRNLPSKPVADGHSTYATNENFYFFLMTLNTTATREKT